MLKQMKLKFYDIIPQDNSHYVCENGQPVARFDDLQKAEFLRDSLMQRQADLLNSLLPTIPTWETI